MTPIHQPSKSTNKHIENPSKSTNQNQSTDQLIHQNPSKPTHQNQSAKSKSKSTHHNQSSKQRLTVLERAVLEATNKSIKIDQPKQINQPINNDSLYWNTGTRCSGSNPSNNQTHQYQPIRINSSTNQNQPTITNQPTNQRLTVLERAVRVGPALRLKPSREERHDGAEKHRREQDNAQRRRHHHSSVRVVHLHHLPKIHDSRFTIHNLSMIWVILTIHDSQFTSHD